MILFKQYFFPLILAGVKTETRRLGKKRWNVGSVHWACHKLFQTEPDCCIKILGVKQERLSAITQEAVHREGVIGTPAEFIAKFKEINKGKPMEPDPLVWVVSFKGFVSAFIHFKTMKFEVLPKHEPT